MNMAELNAETGTNPRQIRYLIVNGLMPSPTGGRAHARYGEEHIEAVHRYKTLRALGLGLDEIRKIRSTPRRCASDDHQDHRDLRPAALEELRRNGRALSVMTFDRLMKERPLVRGRYGERGVEKSIDDILWHIVHLRVAGLLGCGALFVNYIGWIKSVLKEVGVDLADVIMSLSVLRRVLMEKLDREEYNIIEPFLETAIQTFPEIHADFEQMVDSSSSYGALAQLYLDALLSGKASEAIAVAQNILESGLRKSDICVHVIQPAMRQIGLLWQQRRINVGHEHIATSITLEVLARLPSPTRGCESQRPVMVAACAAGELHDIGMRMVADLHERAGWQAVYLGPNTPPDAIISAAVEHRAVVIALSATIAPHIEHVAGTISLARSNMTTRDAYILVGGAPFNTVRDLWSKVGADGTAADAKAALSLTAHLSRP